MRSILIAICFIALFGCSKPSVKETAIGYWHGVLKSGGTVSLQVREDGTFTAILPTSLDGTWSVVDNAIKIKLTKIQGIDIKEAIARAKKESPSSVSWLENPGDFVLNDNRTILRLNPPAGAESAEEILLVKKTEE
ncbi:MAG: hypothetical protein ABL949_00550 [Fimbriimonadaceae bacterium]